MHYLQVKKRLAQQLRIQHHYLQSSVFSLQSSAAPSRTPIEELKHNIAVSDDVTLSRNLQKFKDTLSAEDLITVFKVVLDSHTSRFASYLVPVFKAQQALNAGENDEEYKTLVQKKLSSLSEPYKSWMQEGMRAINALEQPTKAR